MKVHAYERAFLWLGAVMLIVFGITLVITSTAMGIHLPGSVQRLDPAQVREIPPFDEPGVRQTGENRYEVVLLSFAWAFQPREIRIPAGSEVTFIATSTDVIHGLHVEDSRVNMMLIPGQVARNTYQFDDPGTYQMICHEFCGSGHHIMAGEVIVE
jgi:cytochrome c oxidase subunit 2